MRTRWIVGSWLWIATILQLGAQAVVALAWPDGYSLSNNAISDLGVTTCGAFDEAGEQARMVCSPLHAVFNGSLIVTGVLLALGAALLWNCWPRRRTGNVGLVLIILGAVAVALVGLTPWDRYPLEHDAVALLQALFQWAAMLVLAFASSGADRGRWWAVRIVSISALALSVVGFSIFQLGFEGVAVPGIDWGIAERIAFDLLTLWSAAVGLILLIIHRHGSPLMSTVNRRRPHAFTEVRVQATVEGATGPEK